VIALAVAALSASFTGFRLVVDMRDRRSNAAQRLPYFVPRSKWLRGDDGETRCEVMLSNEGGSVALRIMVSCRRGDALPGRSTIEFRQIGRLAPGESSDVTSLLPGSGRLDSTSQRATYQSVLDVAYDVPRVGRRTVTIPLSDLDPLAGEY
jgi:hypothetical protein